MVCGWFSAQGNAWEGVCRVLGFVMAGAMVGALILVAATCVKFRLEVAKHLRRPMLSDEEFALRLADPLEVDRELVKRVRDLASRCFRGLGGQRFYPADRLEEDLHLRDLAPFALEDFCAELEEALGLQQDELRARIATREVNTFGDLVAIAADLACQAGEEVDPGCEDQGGPVRDRALG
jgi:hypothetical protein